MGGGEEISWPEYLPLINDEGESLEVAKRKSKPTQWWVQYQLDELLKKCSSYNKKIIRKSSTIEDMMCSPKNIDSVGSGRSSSKHSSKSSRSSKTSREERALAEKIKMAELMAEAKYMEERQVLVFQTERLTVPVDGKSTIWILVHHEKAMLDIIRMCPEKMFL